MRRLVTGKQMKEIDAYAIQTIGILSMVLMERAALAVADELMQEYQRRGEKAGLDARVLVFCRTGNNGADGAAIARILHLRGDFRFYYYSGGQKPLDGRNGTSDINRREAGDCN